MVSLLRRVQTSADQHRSPWIVFILRPKQFLSLHLLTHSFCPSCKRFYPLDNRVRKLANPILFVRRFRSKVVLSSIRWDQTSSNEFCSRSWQSNFRFISLVFPVVCFWFASRPLWGGVVVGLNFNCACCWLCHDEGDKFEWQEARRQEYDTNNQSRSANRGSNQYTYNLTCRVHGSTKMIFVSFYVTNFRSDL